MNATVEIANGNAVLHYTHADGVEVYARVKSSKLPGWLGAAGLTIQPHTIRIAPHVDTYTDQELAEVLCHEMDHIWQIARWGYFQFCLMDVPRILFRGGSGEKSRNDVETAAYDEERLHWSDFLDAAVALRAAGMFTHTGV